MSRELYSERVAQHYAAYRPPLHEMILRLAFTGSERWRLGVDIGCGTGYSTVALARYCDRVVGVDPSAAMLDSAVDSSHVKYVRATAEHSTIDDGLADVVTYAGSLNYVDREAAQKELLRICHPGATVLVYDFEIQIESVLKHLGVEHTNLATTYEHSLAFDPNSALFAYPTRRESIALSLTSEQLTHILLSDADRFESIGAAAHLSMRPRASLFAIVRSELQKHSAQHDVFAILYFTKYQIRLE